MATIKTSPKTNSSNSIFFNLNKTQSDSYPARDRGFTLFEILIVLGVIAGTMALLIPQMRRSDQGIKKTAHHLYVLTKDIRNQARLKNRTFRLVFNMEGKDHSFWVESAAGLVVPKTQEELEKEARKSNDSSGDSSGDGKPASQFQKEEKYTKKEFPLPRNWFIGHVETGSRKEPVTAGQGYLYFSPQGLVEPAVIQLTNRQQITWSVIVNSLTGQSDIVDKPISLRDLRNK